MEKNMKKKVYVFMDNWITWLYSRNEHNTVNQLYFNKINLKNQLSVSSKFGSQNLENLSLNCLELSLLKDGSLIIYSLL